MQRSPSGGISPEGPQGLPADAAGRPGGGLGASPSLPAEPADKAPGGPWAVFGGGLNAGLAKIAGFFRKKPSEAETAAPPVVPAVGATPEIPAVGTTPVFPAVGTTPEAPVDETTSEAPVAETTSETEETGRPRPAVVVNVTTRELLEASLAGMASDILEARLVSGNLADFDRRTPVWDEDYDDSLPSDHDSLPSCVPEASNFFAPRRPFGGFGRPSWSPPLALGDHGWPSVSGLGILPAESGVVSPGAHLGLASERRVLDQAVSSTSWSGVDGEAGMSGFQTGASEPPGTISGRLAAYLPGCPYPDGALYSAYLDGLTETGRGYAEPYVLDGPGDGRAACNLSWERMPVFPYPAESSLGEGGVVSSEIMSPLPSYRDDPESDHSDGQEDGLSAWVPEALPGHFPARPSWHYPAGSFGRQPLFVHRDYFRGVSLAEAGLLPAEAGVVSEEAPEPAMELRALSQTLPGTRDSAGDSGTTSSGAHQPGWFAGHYPGGLFQSRRLAGIHQRGLLEPGFGDPEPYYLRGGHDADSACRMSWDTLTPYPYEAEPSSGEPLVDYQSRCALEGIPGTRPERLLLPDLFENLAAAGLPEPVVPVASEDSGRSALPSGVAGLLPYFPSEPPALKVWVPLAGPAELGLSGMLSRALENAGRPALPSGVAGLLPYFPSEPPVPRAGVPLVGPAELRLSGMLSRAFTKVAADVLAAEIIKSDVFKAAGEAARAETVFVEAASFFRDMPSGVSPDDFAAKTAGRHARVFVPLKVMPVIPAEPEVEAVFVAPAEPEVETVVEPKGKAVSEVPSENPAAASPSILEKAKAVLAGAGFKETIATPVMILRFRELGGMLKNETIADDKEAWARTMADLSKSLMEVHGVKFSKDNLKYMVKFAEMTPDMETAARWTRNLCWTAVIHILRLGDGDIVKTGLWADKAITERIPLSELKIMSSLEIANRQKQAAENKVEAKEAVNDNKAEVKEAVNDNKVEADVPENKVVAKQQPVVAKQQPVVEPKQQPVAAKQQPAEPKPKPLVAKQQPAVEPKPKPVELKPKPAEAKQQPVAAKQQPAVEPKPKPPVAKQKLAEPKLKPVEAKPKPAEPKQQPAAADSKAKPSVPEDKAPASVPELKKAASKTGKARDKNRRAGSAGRKTAGSADKQAGPGA
jgi:hypothetical protein